MLAVNFKKHLLRFKFKAGTSRGVLTERAVWYITLQDTNNQVYGLGECGPLKGLSIDDREDFEKCLADVLSGMQGMEVPRGEQEIFDLVNNLVPVSLPSVRFGLETALLDLLHGGKRIIFKNQFVKGEKPLAINGLVWMGNRDFMLRQVEEKIQGGFDCIKMKIGALDFEQECSILHAIRERYGHKIVLRVDANGAFSTKEVLEKLHKLAQYDIHSIEQPIKAGQWQEMKKLCLESPIPMALDEELIGMESRSKELLETIRPPFIILKPSLLGGLRATRSWIELAASMGIHWWVTSALESNIGLNAISQFTADFHNSLPQGLGTGMLYENNVPSPLTVRGGFLRHEEKNLWDLSVIGDI